MFYFKDFYQDGQTNPKDLILNESYIYSIEKVNKKTFKGSEITCSVNGKFFIYWSKYDLGTLRILLGDLTKDVIRDNNFYKH